MALGRTLGTKVEVELYEHYEILADLLTLKARELDPRAKEVSVSSLVKQALTSLAANNPISPDDRRRWRASQSETATSSVAVGADGKLGIIARAERPDIQATYDLVRAVESGQASLAADAPRKGRKERRERDSNPESHPVHPTRLSGSTRALRPSSRPAVRPDRTTRRALRAV
jgi:hypothetical protein